MMCKAVLIGCDPVTSPPPPFGLICEGGYWSANIDDISLLVTPWFMMLSLISICVRWCLCVVCSSWFSCFLTLSSLFPRPASRFSSAAILWQHSPSRLHSTSPLVKGFSASIAIKFSLKSSVSRDFSGPVWHLSLHMVTWTIIFLNDDSEISYSCESKFIYCSLQ